MGIEGLDSEKSPWADKLGLLFTEESLKQRLAEDVSLDSLISVGVIDGDRLYPLGQFDLKDETLALSPRRVVLGLWNDVFEPAVQNGGLSEYQAASWLLGPDSRGLSRADVLADPNASDVELDAIIEDAVSFVGRMSS